MSLDSIKSLSHFTVLEQLKLVLGLLISPLFKNNKHFQTLLNEKRGLDFLYRCNREVKKIDLNTILIRGKRNVNHDYKFQLRRYSSDVDVFRQLYYHPDYPMIIDKVIQTLGGVEKVFTIIDGGAYIGLSTFYWASTFPEARVIAIEAEKSNFDLLQKNVQMNTLLNVQAENLALWSHEENLNITREKMDKRPWAFAVEATTDQPSDMIPGISLSKLLINRSIDQIDVLKLDIEGAEKEVFLQDEGIGKVLESTKIIICELHYFDQTKKHILKKLKDYGFIISSIGEDLFCINKKLISS
ncbi:MAG: FkbM family methyltransferase [Cyclobacteriaceae bacterium]